MKTGFKALDEIITLDKNKLIFVAGKAGVGKTTFAVKLLNNIAIQNVSSLFFSLELSKESITNENAEALFIDDTANVTIDYIEGKCRNLEQEQNISKGNYPEIQIIQVYGKDNEQVKLNMEFLGLDLSKVLTQSLNDWKVYVIPALYVISSIISLKITYSSLGSSSSLSTTDKK